MHYFVTEYSLLYWYSTVLLWWWSFFHSLLMTGYPQHNNEERDRRKFKWKKRKKKKYAWSWSLCSKLKAQLSSRLIIWAVHTEKIKTNAQPPPGFNWMCSSLLLQAGTSARADAIISGKAKEVPGVQAKGCLWQCPNPEVQPWQWGGGTKGWQHCLLRSSLRGFQLWEVFFNHHPLE